MTFFEALKLGIGFSWGAAIGFILVLLFLKLMENKNNAKIFNTTVDACLAAISWVYSLTDGYRRRKTKTSSSKKRS